MYICTRYVNVPHDANADASDVRMSIIKQMTHTGV